MTDWDLFADITPTRPPYGLGETALVYKEAAARFGEHGVPATWPAISTDDELGWPV